MSITIVDDEEMTRHVGNHKCLADQIRSFMNAGGNEVVIEVLN